MNQNIWKFKILVLFAVNCEDNKYIFRLTQVMQSHLVKYTTLKYGEPFTMMHFGSERDCCGYRHQQYSVQPEINETVPVKICHLWCLRPLQCYMLHVFV